MWPHGDEMETTAAPKDGPFPLVLGLEQELRGSGPCGPPSLRMRWPRGRTSKLPACLPAFSFSVSSLLRRD